MRTSFRYVTCLASIIALLGACLCMVYPSRAQTQAAQEQNELSLAVGENRTISAAEVKSYSEGAPGIVEVKLTPGGGQFVIVGTKPGSTTLLMIKRDGSEVTWTLHVFARPIRAVEGELKELLLDTPGIRVRRVGARFFIEGGVSSEAELKRIEHIARLYEGQVESLVVLGGVAADRKINIRVDVYFVQYTKTKNFRVGIAWPQSLAGEGIGFSRFAYDFLRGTVQSAQATVINQPLPALDMAARNGWAKVLKHATVITSNGAPAEFSSGGAQNFQLITGLTASVQKIEFGTTVKLLPRFDPNTRELQIDVGTDVSDFVPPVSGTILPGQATSTLSTTVALKLGQALVLSGIRTASQRRTKSGIPWLSEIPVIGALFGSISDEKEDVEGAAFVIPSVIDRPPRLATELVDRALSEYRGFSGDMRTVAPFDEASSAAREK
jgi:pilus assembly protein CpaC